MNFYLSLMGAILGTAFFVKMAYIAYCLWRGDGRRVLDPSTYDPNDYL